MGQQTVAPNLDVACRYLNLLYAVEPAGYLNLCTFNGPVEWFRGTNLDEMARRAVNLATTQNVYHSIGPRSEAYFRGLLEPGAERGGSGEVVGLPGFWLDADYADPAHTKSNLPPTPYAALDLINEFPLKPTLLVSSGHGFQAWFLFHGLWALGSDEECEQAAVLLKRFHATMLSKARAHGWTLDNTSDLARVFRVAGTVNHKDHKHPMPVRIIVCDETRRYRPEDFAPYLAYEPEIRQPSRNGHAAPTGLCLDDEDLVRRAMAARDGDKFARLWAGDISDYGNDHSAADIAFCNLLAFWTNRDPVQIDRLFCRSGLWRPKWDQPHYATGETYGQHTIAEAIATTDRGYGPGYAAAQAPGQDGASGFTDELDYLRRELAKARLEKARISALQSLQWRVFANGKLKGVGVTAARLASECIRALEAARDDDSWVRITLSGEHGIAAAVGKSARRASDDIKKLEAWGFVKKLVTRPQLTDGPAAGQLRTILYVRFTMDPLRALEALTVFDPGTPTWGGKRVVQCVDHPEAPIIRRTTYSCSVCGQIVADPREQVLAPTGQDVRSEEQATRDGETPDQTRCPVGDADDDHPSDVDIRTLEGGFCTSGTDPPAQPVAGSAEAALNPLHELALALFRGSRFVEGGT